MEKIKLQAKHRDTFGKKVAKLRREGLIPAVMYSKGKEGTALSVDKKLFDHVYKLSGGSTILTLEIEGDKDRNVLIKEVDRNPVTDNVVHADFYQVKMTEKITATVPLRFIGDSKAVMDLSGSLITNKSEVEVECLPADLPHEIEVDISLLEDFESVLHISDIKLPPGVEVKDDPEETLAFVEAPRSEEELAELEEPVEEGEMPEAERGGEETAAEGEEPKAEEAPEAKKE